MATFARRLGFGLLMVLLHSASLKLTSLPSEELLMNSFVQRTGDSHAAQVYPGYEIVWSDEFDRDGRPDPANWTYERGFVRNQELQRYQPENARVEKGMLIIEARRERKGNANHLADSSDWRRNREFAEYTSSSLTTRGLHQWQYGRIEMRARIDTRPGMWPAFWTLGVSGGWPRNGEVDIMEFYRGDLLANAAWGSARRGQAVSNDTRKPISAFGDPDWSRRFHLWRMDWDENRIRLYADNQMLNDVDLSETVNQDGSGINPFHQPHYLMVNLAIGGQGGDPSATEFPAKYEVDYIRVYRKEGGLFHLPPMPHQDTNGRN